jgi:chorismate dehydratase
MDVPKIGAVSYLNTKPLVEGMDRCTGEFELVFDLPSRLADRLADGQLDVALIPVIEAIADPDYVIVSDACIACHGPVWSVKLLSRVDPRNIETLSLDEGSRTSCGLSRVLLDQQFGVRPTCRPLAIADDWRTSESDAVLIIGDRAMKAEDSRFPFSLDLGEAWNRWTGRPFVFAVWAARPGADLERLNKILSTARDLGLTNVEAIAAEHAPHYDLSYEECLRYLRENLHFHLGDQEKSGLELFFERVANLSLISQPSQLQFHDCQTTG